MHNVMWLAQMWGGSVNGRRESVEVERESNGMRFLVVLLGTEGFAHAHPWGLGARRVVGIECTGNLARV